jgi:hypothetical protein
MKQLNFKSIAGGSYTLTHPLAKPGDHGRIKNIRITEIPEGTDTGFLSVLVNSMFFQNVFDVKFNELKAGKIMKGGIPNH